MIMNMTIYDLINLFMIAVGVGIGFLCILQIRKTPFDKSIKKYFLLLFSLIITYVLMHLTRQMLGGNEGEVVRIIVYIVTFIEFFTSGFMVYMLSMLILLVSNSNNKKKIEVLFFVVFLIHSIVLAISQFTNLYYYFDEFNVYHRSSLYILSNFAHAIMMITDMVLLIKYSSKFTKRIRLAFWLYLLLPLVAMGVQAFISEIQFVIFATVGTSVYMYSVIVSVLFTRFETQRLEANRLDTELSMATRIQADMLPNIFPAFPERKEFDIFASMNPAKEVGGDFYDFFLIDDDHLGLVMADVSGKGVPAALFMMVSKILVQNYTLMNKNPKLALEATNHQICQTNNEEMFVTVWLGILDLKTGVITAANAGHEYPALQKPNGEFELFLDKHGFVVGGMPNVKYREYEIQLEEGSKLFLYTDGVCEATDKDNVLFGTERMLKALNEHKDGTPKEIVEGVDKSIKEFVKNAPQFDDITMLCLSFHNKE